jgi:hypothetical protein
MFMQNSGAPRGENVKSCVNVIARSEATKPSIPAWPHGIFAEPVTGRALARLVARNDVVDKPVQMRAIGRE